MTETCIAKLRMSDPAEIYNAGRAPGDGHTAPGSIDREVQALLCGNGSHFWNCRAKLPSISSSVAACLVAMLSRGGDNAGINKIWHALGLHIPGAIT